MIDSGDKEVAARIADRYPTRFLREYVYWKIRTDPIYRFASECLAPAADVPLLDLGCGAGVLAFYLREHGFTGPVRGVDLDGEKIAVARTIAARMDPDAVFDCMDFRDVSDARLGHVTLLDVLLYVGEAAQRYVLERAASFVKPDGGLLIVRSGVGDGTWRHKLTEGMDHVAAISRWMKVHPVSYPSRRIFVDALGPLGFDVEFRPMWGRTPFNNYAIVARRKR